MVLNIGNIVPLIGALAFTATQGCNSPGPADTSGTGGAGGKGGAAGQGGAPDTASSSGSGGTGGSGGAPLPAPGYLHTKGSDILDDQGNIVRLTGVSWFGLDTISYSPHGLWKQRMATILDAIKKLGVNVIRLPYCNQAFDPGSKPTALDANPDLDGLDGLAIMDKVVEGAKARDIKVILSRRNLGADEGAPVWYNGVYSEERWIKDWKDLAQHYKGNSTVIGFDLHDQLHEPAAWGGGDPATDWRAAAEKAGNAILDVNPDVLIIVQGVDKVVSSYYWWGGNLRKAATDPVKLKIPGKLVYGTVDYPPSFNPKSPWFEDTTYPANMPQVWEDNWGYLLTDHVAPVLIVAFGGQYANVADKKWFDAMGAYIKERKLSFAYWSLNPDNAMSNGVLQANWLTPNVAISGFLQPLLGAPIVP